MISINKKYALEPWSTPQASKTVFSHLGYRVAENKEGRETPQMHVKCD